jgi:hypothetical protein
MRQRLRPHLTYANVMATMAVFLVLGGGAYAATGDNLILGQSNSASSRTSLSAPISDRALQLTNTNTGAGATALGLNVASGHAPFTVNSGTKVPNLNADKLDGIDATDVARGHSRVLHASVAPPSAGANNGALIVVPGYGTVRFDCNTTGQIAVDYTNHRNFIQFVVEDQGNPNPTAYRLNPGDTTTQTAHVGADSVTYHVSNGLVETAVIMVAGQKYNDPGFPFQDFCTLQATAISRIP